VTVEHRAVKTNGITLHFAEAGQGPLVVLCHGFPETWYSWRHQLEFLASSGWHVLAPDQRGYGRTDIPTEVEKYTILHLVADIVGLVQAQQSATAAIVGHDWGSIVAAHCALMRPDLFKAVALLSVPYVPRQWTKHKPTEVLGRVFGGKPTYHIYFQEPGAAERELEQDVHRTLLSMFYSLSGSVPPEYRWKPVIDKGQRLLDTTTLPAELPSWLTQQDLQTYEKDFERSGFTGGLNWYRNLDRNWELTASLTEAPLSQPSMFLAGELDPILGLYRNYQTAIAKSMPGLRQTAVLKGIGHWITQEDPITLNRLLLDFLAACGT